MTGGNEIEKSEGTPKAAEQGTALLIEQDTALFLLQAPITGGASISRTLTNGTLFKIDYNNDGTYDMQWDLDDYTGTADQVTVVT